MSCLTRHSPSPVLLLESLHPWESCNLCLWNADNTRLSASQNWDKHQRKHPGNYEGHAQHGQWAGKNYLLQFVIIPSLRTACYHWLQFLILKALIYSFIYICNPQMQVYQASCLFNSFNSTRGGRGRTLGRSPINHWSPCTSTTSGASGTFRWKYGLLPWNPASVDLQRTV